MRSEAWDLMVLGFFCYICTIMSGQTTKKGDKAAAAEAPEKTLQERIQEAVTLAKQKYDTIFVVEVGDKFAILRKADRNTYGKAIGHMTPIPGIKNDPDPLSAGITLVTHCFVGGDPEIKSDDDYLIPAAMQAVAMIQQKRASLEKH